MALDAILELLVALLGVIHPSDLQKVRDKIEELEKQYEADEKLFNAAVAAGDINAINALVGSYLHKT